MARLMLDPGNFLLLDVPTNHLDLPSREALEEALARFEGSLLFVSHDRYFINKAATRVAGFIEGRLEMFDRYDEYQAARLHREGGGEGRPAARKRTAAASTPAAARPGAVAERAAALPERPGAGPQGPKKSERRSERTEGGQAAPSSTAASGPAAQPGRRGRDERRAEAEARSERHRRLKPLRDEVARLEKRIEAVEARLKEIDAALADPQTYQVDGRARDLGASKKEIEIDLAHLYDEWDQATRSLQEAEAGAQRQGSSAGSSKASRGSGAPGGTLPSP